MHNSVMNFISGYATTKNFKGKSVIEVGSFNVNGSVRPMIKALDPSVYIGTDMRAGKDVDIVVNAIHLTDYFGPNLFDVVISTEMLEHVEDWRRAINEMKNILKPGGLLLLTTRSKGFPLHDYPADHWRFETSDMHVFFSDMMADVFNDTQDPGVFVKAVHWAPKEPNIPLEQYEVWSMKNA